MRLVLCSSKAFLFTPNLGFGVIVQGTVVIVVVKAVRGSKLRLRPQRHQRKRYLWSPDFSICDFSFC